MAAQRERVIEDKPLIKEVERNPDPRPKNHSKPLFLNTKRMTMRSTSKKEKCGAHIFSTINKNLFLFFSSIRKNFIGLFVSLRQGFKRVFRRGFLMGVSILYYKVKRQLKKDSLEIFRFIKSSSRLWLPIGVLAIAVAIFLSANTYCIALKVVMDGRTLGYIHEQDDFELARANAETSMSAVVGNAYHLDAEPQYAFAIVKHDKIIDPSQIEGELTKNAKADLGQTYGVYVDNELVAVNESENDLLDLLDSIKEPYLSDASGETVEFIKSVEIKKGIYPKNQLLDIDEVRSILLVSQDSVTYTVKKGDSASAIADKFSLSVASLKTLNKGLDVNKLGIGQKIKIANAGTILGVRVVRTIKYNEAIDYNTVKKSTNTLYKGEESVKVSGAKGTREITATVTLVDGEETARVIKGKRVVKQPVDRVVMVGTKTVAPSGTFRWPVGGSGGVITSTFYDRRGRSRHNAIDIGAQRGTSVLAADGGTVYYVNYSSSAYGNQVVIDHGNGIRTRYAHCSKIYVKAGQKVPKGYTIAAVGSTGWSTGPHLHFEIMKIGKGGSITFVNPLTLVKK